MAENTFLLIVISLATTFPLLRSQTPAPTFDRGSCPQIQITDLGETDRLSFNGLLPLALRERVGFGVGPSPEVRIIDFHVVCEAAGRTRGTAGSVSMVVMFECRGEACVNTTVENPVVNSTEQIQLNCTLEFFEGGFVGGDNYETSTFSGMIRTVNPDATFDTPLDDRCGVCVDPSTGVAEADVKTHCISCSEMCTEGQRRCIGPGPDQCCNWYLNNTCVVTCPAPLVGDIETFDCGCPELSVENGVVTYSDRFLPGSISRYTCSEGFELSPPCENTRVCTSFGWSNVDYTCERVPPPVTIAAVTPLPPIISSDSSPLKGAVIALSILSVIIFILGLALGVCGHHIWANRQRPKKEKDSYSLDKPVLPAVKILEEDIERVVYASNAEGDNAYSQLVSDSSSSKDSPGDIELSPEGIELSENSAYGSQTHLLEATTAKQEATEQLKVEKEDNSYVSDPMGLKQSYEANNLVKNTVVTVVDDELYETINDSTVESNSDREEVHVDENVAYSSQKSGEAKRLSESVTGVNDEELYDTINDGPDSNTEQGGVDVGANVAYSTNIEQDGVDVGANVAYNTNSHDSEQDYYSEPAESVRHVASSVARDYHDNIVPTGDNVAYKSTTSSKIEDYDGALMENGAYEVNPTTREAISVGDNAAYQYHSNGRDSDDVIVAENAAYATKSMSGGKEISVEENVAYVAHENGGTTHVNEDDELDYNTAYVSRNPSDQPDKIAVEDNIAYLQHAKRDDKGVVDVSKRKPKKPAIAARRKVTHSKNVKNGYHATSNGSSEDAIGVTENIKVSDNVSYLTHNNPNVLNTDTPYNHHHSTMPATENKPIPTSGNIAYATALHTDELSDNGAYLSSPALVGNGGGGLQGNVAYSTGKALATVREEEEGDYVINQY